MISCPKQTVIDLIGIARPAKPMPNYDGIGRQRQSIVNDRLFLSWEPSNSRSTTLAHELSARCEFVHYLALKRPFFAPFKYLMQAV